VLETGNLILNWNSKNINNKMRSTNVILFIALVAISFSNAFEFTSLAEVKELRSTSYGNSLIETISLTLANNGNVEQVQSLLTDLLTRLIHDQEAADNAWAKEKARLNARIAVLTKEITELHRQIAVDENDKKTNENKRDHAIANLAQYHQQVSDNNAALVRNEANRQKDKTTFEASEREHWDVINAIAATIKELNKLVGSVSGKAKPVHVVEDAAEKRDREYAALKHSFAQMTRDEAEAIAFAELATTADQAALHKLIDLLNTLETDTKKSLADDNAHEQASIKSFASLKALLIQDNARLSSTIAEQEKRLAHYRSEIQRLTVKIAEETQLVISKEAERVATIKERDQKEAQYNADTAERTVERGVVTRLQKIVNERLAKMTAFLKSQVN
jgi:hypothetical protein